MTHKTNWKTIHNGFLTDFAMRFDEYNVIYKIGETFHKRKMHLDLVPMLRQMDGFRYANIYTLSTRIQIASLTKTSSKWFVKRQKTAFGKSLGF